MMDGVATTLLIEPFTLDNMAYGCALGKELHAQGALSYIPFDESYNRALTAHKMHDPSWWLRLARTTDGGEYCGVMVGNVTSTLFSQRLIGYEQLLYVRKGTKYRGAIALNLVRNFLSWCYTIHGCVMVQSGDVAAINSLAVDALYRHAGFKRFGAIYAHEPYAGGEHVQ